MDTDPTIPEGVTPEPGGQEDLEDENLKNFRIQLSDITAIYIKYGLRLLGIGVVDKM